MAPSPNVMLPYMNLFDSVVWNTRTELSFAEPAEPFPRGPGTVLLLSALPGYTRIASTDNNLVNK